MTCLTLISPKAQFVILLGLDIDLSIHNALNTYNPDTTTSAQDYYVLRLGLGADHTTFHRHPCYILF